MCWHSISEKSMRLNSTSDLDGNNACAFCYPNIKVFLPTVFIIFKNNPHLFKKWTLMSLIGGSVKQQYIYVWCVICHQYVELYISTCPCWEDMWALGMMMWSGKAMWQMMWVGSRWYRHDDVAGRREWQCSGAKTGEARRRRRRRVRSKCDA